MIAKPHLHRCVLLIVLLVWPFVLPGLCAAQAVGLQGAQDLPLVPVTSPGFIRLASCILVARLTCAEGLCTLRVEQSYQLHNRDRVKGALLRLGIPAKVGNEAVRLPEFVLRDRQGNTLPPLGASTAHSAVWDLSLGRDERRTLVLAYTHTLPASHFLRWRWEMPQLGSWGTIESARVEFRLPQYTTDDAFLVFEPRSANFDNTTLVWQYENLEGAPRHELVMWSPATWKQIKDWTAARAHRELGRLYLSVQDEAQRLKLPIPDPWDRAMAEFRAALAADPLDLATRLELARGYQARAASYPALKLNYLLLAAQELATVLEKQPGQGEIARALSRAYYDAALTANANGDPAGALAYLQKASDVPGVQLAQEREKREELSLRWALDMANQGQVSQAIVQLDNVLSPQTKDALLRYAPPFVVLHTDVELTPHERRVRYVFRLYPPSARQTAARLQDLAGRLRATGSCQADLTWPTNQALLELRVSYATLPELRQRSAVLVGVLTADADFMTVLLAVPWQTELRAYATQVGLWRDRSVYQEKVNLTALPRAWNAEAQYSRWRLIELRDAKPATERAQLEQRLALMALSEQGQLWEQLPSASYWSFALSDFAARTAASPSWLVPWGQARDLEVAFDVYHWDRLVPLLLVVGMVLLVLGGLVAVLRK